MRWALLVSLASTLACACGGPPEKAAAPQRSAPAPENTAPAPAPVKTVAAKAPAPTPTPAPTPAPACPAALTEAPTSLWSERVLLQLPAGVELVEQRVDAKVQPGIERAASPGSAESACGATVQAAAVGSFPREGTQGRPMSELRDMALARHGIQATSMTWNDKRVIDGDYTGEFVAAPQVGVEAEAGAGPSAGLLRLKQGADRYYWMVLEAKASDYPKLSATFEASAASLLVLPRPPAAASGGG